MRTARKLLLKRESLTELATDELNRVAGGAPTITTCAVSEAIHPCLSNDPVCDTVSRAIRPCLTDVAC